MANQNVEYISNLILNSKHLVIFTGAGISTPSGLPDYRGPDGVWTRRDKGLPPRKFNKPWSEFEPNIAHQSIVKLQNLGFLKALISQNVDGLHLKSGINPELITELHGNSTIMKCIDCDKRFSKKEIHWEDSIHGRGYRTSPKNHNQPKCINCNGTIISSVINFGDPMPDKESNMALDHSKKADVYLVIGSSLAVNPAASYPRIAKNNNATLIILNKGETMMDNISDLKLEVNCAQILPQIVDCIESQMDLVI